MPDVGAHVFAIELDNDAGVRHTGHAVRLSIRWQPRCQSSERELEHQGPELQQSAPRAPITNTYNGLAGAPMC